jgi:hypothetical protein
MWLSAKVQEVADLWLWRSARDWGFGLRLKHSEEVGHNMYSCFQVYDGPVR